MATNISSPPQRSPYDLSAPSFRESLTGMKYHIENRVSPPLPGKTIIQSARETIRGPHWTELLEAKSIIAAANAVKSLGHSSTPKFDHAATKLLDVISLSYIDIVQGPAGDTTPAVVSSWPDTREIPGDHLAACSMADTTAFMTTCGLLKNALKATAKKPFFSRQDLTELVGVDIRGQLLCDLAALKHYRINWLSFEQDFASPKLARGFLVSWQNAPSTFNDPALLERTHKGGWLPGLVRWAERRITSKSVSLARSTRVQEIVHLASIGNPPSQCISALHLFKVVFDAIGVRENLMGEDILHRDLSWFNLLCDQRHDPSADGRLTKRSVLTIECILTGKQSEPCALLLGLDHAAVMTELHSAGYMPRKGITGTPMFTAVELSSEDPVKTTGFSPSLLERLEAFDQLPMELRARACANDDGTFMKVFNEIYDLEDSRASVRHKHYGATTDPSALHRARHDMESLSWILLWALLWASPLFGPPAGLTNDLALSETANILLNHRLGTKEEVRSAYRRDPPVGGLHPLLKTFGELLTDMATYLRVPWHLYEDTVEGLAPNHVHIAFCRILLVQIHELSLNNAAKDVLFDCRRPRSIREALNLGKYPIETRMRSTGTLCPSYPLRMSDSSSASQNLVLRLRNGEGLARPSPLREIVSRRGSKCSAADRDPEDLDESQPSTKRVKSTQGVREMLASTSAQTDASLGAHSVDVLTSDVDDDTPVSPTDDAAEAGDSNDGPAT